MRLSGRRGSTEGKRSRPECGGEPDGTGVGQNVGESGRGVRVVCDQRVELRAALYLENPGDGCGICCVGAEAVHRFGAEGDQLSGTEQRGGACDAWFIRYQPLGHGLSP